MWAIGEIERAKLWRLGAILYSLIGKALIVLVDIASPKDESQISWVPVQYPRWIVYNQNVVCWLTPTMSTNIH